MGCSILNSLHAGMVEIKVNPCFAQFFSGNVKSYWHFVSFLNTEMVQVVEINPFGRQGPVEIVYSVPWLLVSW